MPRYCDGCKPTPPSQQPEARRRYFAENPDARARRAAGNRVWRQTTGYDRNRYWSNPEHHRERRRRYVAEHPDYWSTYYAANREVIIEKANQYRRDHPTAARRGTALRNQRLRHPGAEPIDPFQVFVEDNWTCGICKLPVNPQARRPDPNSAELDHIIPIARGGLHTRANVQCSHRGCNLSKGARAPG